MKFLSLTAIVFLSSLIFKCRSVQGTVNSPAGVLQKFFSQCSQKEEIIKCFKIQALKVTERALHLRSFNIVNGLSIVSNDRVGKSVGGLVFNETKLEKLPDDDLDSLLGDRTSRFLDTHTVEVSIPRLVEETSRSLSGEARRRKGGGGRRKGGNYGALLAALAIKGSFLAVAYKGIAIMSGTALIFGKMALLLTAILGLKKLVSGNREKTTFEIIKTPKYTEEHIHSSAHEDDNHDHYRRSYLDTGGVQRRVYRFHIPQE